MIVSADTFFNLLSHSASIHVILCLSADKREAGGPFHICQDAHVQVPARYSFGVNKCSCICSRRCNLLWCRVIFGARVQSSHFHEMDLCIFCGVNSFIVIIFVGFLLAVGIWYIE